MNTPSPFVSVVPDKFNVPDKSNIYIYIYIYILSTAWGRCGCDAPKDLPESVSWEPIPHPWVYSIPALAVCNAVLALLPIGIVFRCDDIDIFGDVGERHQSCNCVIDLTDGLVCISPWEFNGQVHSRITDPSP